MENSGFDREKVIEQMRSLIDAEQGMIDQFNQAQIDEYGMVLQKITLQEIKYLGKIRYTVEGREELVEKDVYMIVEEVGGELQYKFYDEDMQELGYQQARYEQIILSDDLEKTKTPEIQKEIATQLEEKDKDEAKTLEELEEEQKQQEEQGPQLTKSQVDSFKGPKTSLNQIVQGETLANAIGIEGGAYIKMLDVSSESARNKIKKWIPDAEIPSGQRTVPCMIFSDGTANLIGEDKLKLSRLEGINSTQENVTATNEGTIRSEQNLETFNIVSKGGMHTIAVGYDETGTMPLEVKYGKRDIDEPTKIGYTELETVHEGPIQQDYDTQKLQQDASKGIKQGEKMIEDAIRRYTEEMKIMKIDEKGQPIGYDYELGRKKLEQAWNENPDATLDELIEGAQHGFGPRSHHP